MALGIALVLATPANAQRTSRLELGGAILAAGQEANYLRALGLTDTLRDVSWSIQPFTAALEARLARRTAGNASHPWAAQLASTAIGQPSAFAERAWGEVRYQLLRPDAQLIYNSALPVGMNDGVLWAGRGATVAAQAGIAARWKWLRVQLAPIAFHAQNADFDIAPNGQTGFRIYADGRYPLRIDLPQRFGNAPYGRLDPGDSFIEAQAFGVSAGFSTARLNWGPGRDHPLVQSTNAGGFPHGFIGTAAPVDIYIGDVQARLIGGRMEQTDYSPIQTGPLHRFHTGFIGTFAPKLFPGLELGGTRIMNVRWREGMPTLKQILRPFSGVINDQVGPINQNEENQFASVFFRLAPRGSGFEAYGEYSREDFSGTWRWLAMQPDDLAGIMFGATHARASADGSLRVLRAEFVNADLSHQERGGRTNVRPIPIYWHVHTRQGLTSRGQIIGSAAAYGGAGGNVSWERFTPAGRTLIGADRYVHLDWLPPMGPVGGTPHAEVRYGLRYERTRFVGNREWGIVIAPSHTLNRNLEEQADVFNLNLQVRWRGW